MTLLSKVLFLWRATAFRFIFWFKFLFGVCWLGDRRRNRIIIISLNLVSLATSGRVVLGCKQAHLWGAHTRAAKQHSWRFCTSSSPPDRFAQQLTLRSCVTQRWACSQARVVHASKHTFGYIQPYTSHFSLNFYTIPFLSTTCNNSTMLQDYPQYTWSLNII